MPPVLNDLPENLSEIIQKVKEEQILSREEHLLYLMYIKGLTEDEALMLIEKRPAENKKELQ